MKNVMISADLLERVRALPGAAGMEDIQLISRFLKAGLAAAEREEISAARSTLLKILAGLSGDALAYVWRPIMYAYLWTDEHDPDRLTPDDLCRLRLSVAIANSSPGEVAQLDAFLHTVQRFGGEVLA